MGGKSLIPETCRIKNGYGFQTMVIACFPQMNIKLTKTPKTKQKSSPPPIIHSTETIRAPNFELKRFPSVAELGL